MSLMNAWVGQDEAFVAVDTDGVNIAGGRFPASKLLAIPHLNVAIACRGQAAFLNLVFLRCVTGGFDTFDQLDDAMPAILAAIDDALLSAPAELIVSAPHVRSGAELLAVGWSNRLSSMHGRRFVKRDGDERFSADDFGLHVAPWEAASMQDLDPAGRGPRAVVEISTAQVRWMRERFANAACGGKLLVCQVTRQGMAMCHRLAFEPAEEMTA